MTTVDQSRVAHDEAAQPLSEFEGRAVSELDAVAAAVAERAAGAVVLAVESCIGLQATADVVREHVRQAVVELLSREGGV